MAASAIHMAPIASPFLNEPDFTSPSLSSAQLQGSTNSPLFDSVDIQPPSPRLPHTPSYNGSYQNSPYTTYSELSYSGGQDLAEPLGLFDDPLSRGTLEEYNPSEYDAPNSGGLLMFDMGFMNAVDNSDPQITLAVSPPADSPYDAAGSPYSHPSPGSSNGHEGVRSRNSSVSSNHHAMSAPATMPDFSHQFDNMGPFSPTNSQKPQSPPRLIIQDSSSPANTHFPPPPVINAPEGDAGGLSGPQLNVVPATPVSGGGAVNPATGPFQTMESLHQRAAQPSWDMDPQAGQPAYNYGLAGGVSPHIPQNTLAPADPNYLQNRIRRRSEGNMIQPAPGMWTIQPEDEPSLLDDNVNLLAFTPGSSPGSTASFHTAAANNGMNNHMVPHPQRPPHMAHNYTFGPPSSTAAHLGHSGAASNSTGLSPHLSANLMLGSSPHMSPSLLPGQSGQFLSPMDGAVQLRRARSDGARGHRQVRSEDFNNFTPGSVQQDYPQFLAPDIGLSGMARAGHMRRASSGSRSDRGLGVMQGGMIPGAWGSSARSSPYPSPNASPRGPVDNIPLPDVSIRRGQRPSNIQTDEHGVVKQNVTTHATKDASEKRRKVEAAFVCPVPGCGSTFTRHFNLKGHMRSHNEEKPYQCKWPGCPKSFARQHDCRRHENLHLNIRPFTCDGCKKTFARMDALNRHLRSEGGLECQKTQTEFPSGGDEVNQQMPGGGGVAEHYSLGMPKTEADGWSTGGYMM